MILLAYFKYKKKVKSLNPEQLYWCLIEFMLESAASLEIYMLTQGMLHV